MYSPSYVYNYFFISKHNIQDAQMQIGETLLWIYKVAQKLAQFLYAFNFIKY